MLAHAHMYVRLQGIVCDFFPVTAGGIINVVCEGSSNAVSDRSSFNTRKANC